MAEQARYHSASDHHIDDKKRRYAILVADMLNDFVYGKLKCERAKRIIPNIKLLIDSARKKGIPIFYCNDEHLVIDTHEMKIWGPHAMKGTEGAKVIEELKPHKSDYIIPKRAYSAFEGTGLDMALRGIQRQRCRHHYYYWNAHTHMR